MKIRQISIFIENKIGRLCEVTDILTKANIDIRGLSLADTADYGVLRLIVDDVDKAEAVLKKENFSVGKTNVVAAEIEDKPGGLNKILQTVSEADINIEYMYAIIHKTDHAILIFRFDNNSEALELFKKMKINTISEKDF